MGSLNIQLIYQKRVSRKDENVEKPKKKVYKLEQLYIIYNYIIYVTVLL